MVQEKNKNLELFSEKEISILEQIIFKRRDVRGNRFLNKEIDDNLIRRILMAGIHAPSVGFSQPWEFVVIKAPATKRKIKASFNKENYEGMMKFDKDKQKIYNQLKLEGIEEAPINIAVFYKSSTEPTLGQTTMDETGKYSVICAIENMWLMARALDIGLGWISILDPLKVKQILNAPQNHHLVGYLALGYVDQFYSEPELKTIGWNQQKKLDDVLIYEYYEK